MTNEEFLIELQADDACCYYKADDKWWDVANQRWLNEETANCIAGNFQILSSTTKKTAVRRLYDILTFKSYPSGDLMYEALTLDECKALRLQELTDKAAKYQESACQEMYFTSSLGFKANGDRKAIQDLEGLALTFETVNSSGTVSFMDYDNNIQQLTLEQINTLRAEHALNGQNLYAQKWTYRNAINAAEDTDALKAVNISFTMMDFSA